MNISVVIPAYNEENLLGRCLGCVGGARSAFARLGWESEVIVCDNNSTDRTPEIARAHGATVVFEPVNQIARARNRGAAAARGDWLLFVDADSFPAAALFSDVGEAIRSGACLGGGSTVELDEYRGGAVAWVCLWNCLSRWTRWAAGSLVFCEAAAFRELGGFSLELFVSEEIEFSQRLKALARRRRQRVVILHRHPLRTSPRKLHLYTGRDLWTFVGCLLRKPLQFKRDRASCAIWYDGRR